MSYKYAIKHSSGGFSFRLYPNNSNIQDVGRSELFQTEDECREALEQFRASGAIFRNDPSLYEIVEEAVGDNKKFIFRFHYGNGKRFFYRKREYWQRCNCEKGIRCVIDNIDAPLKVF